MDDQPSAFYLAVNVGDPNGEINRLTFGIGTGDTLNAVAETHISISCDAQVADFEL